MLTVKEIKDGCVFAEGFEYSESNKPSLMFPDGQWCYLDHTSELFQVMIYDLFLQKIIEGMSKTIPNVAIVTLWSGLGWWCLDCADDKFELPATTYDSPEEAKEEAIKHILGEI